VERYLVSTNVNAAALSCPLLENRYNITYTNATIL